MYTERASLDNDDIPSQKDSQGAAWLPWQIVSRMKHIVLHGIEFDFYFLDTP